ncbi:MAG TPA: hypothetical protein VNR11_06020 [Xanthobacteraceae bacterium]|nr:hypothetical protein [Xanthobacteraceae bacterium]
MKVAIVVEFIRAKSATAVDLSNIHGALYAFGATPTLSTEMLARSAHYDMCNICSRNRQATRHGAICAMKAWENNIRARNTRRQLR